MQRHAGDFTRRPDIFNGGMSLNIRMYAAHGIMRHSADRDGLFNWIKSDVFYGHFTDKRKSLKDLIPAEVTQIQMKVIQAARSGEAATRFDLGHL